jgi:hypothetical protein
MQEKSYFLRPWFQRAGSAAVLMLVTAAVGWTAPPGSPHVSPETAVAHAKQTKIPLQQRRDEIAALKNQADDESADALMMIGDGNAYLQEEAIQALGDLSDNATPQTKQKAAVYLKKKLTSADAGIVAAASRSVIKLEGESTFEDLGKVLRENRRRPDGHELMIQAAVVEALGASGSHQAVPLLAAELAQVDEPGWELEYGSMVIQALRQIGGAEARAAALEYANKLAARSSKDALEQEYLVQKISEARSVRQ